MSLSGNPKFKGGFLYIGILGNSATSSFVLKISLLSTAEQAGGQEAKSVKTALAARLKLLSSEKSVALAHCQVVEVMQNKLTNTRYLVTLTQPPSPKCRTLCRNGKLVWSASGNVWLLLPPLCPLQQLLPPLLAVSPVQQLPAQLQCIYQKL